MRSVEECDIEAIDKREGCDGHQDNTFVKRKVSNVWMELLSNECLNPLGPNSALMQTVTGYLVAIPMDH